MRTSRATARAPAPDLVRCARCGHASTLDAWRARPRERTLTRSDLDGAVLGWPDDLTVEVRACAGCGAPIARTSGGTGGKT